MRFFKSPEPERDCENSTALRNYTGLLALADFYWAWNAFKDGDNRAAAFYACFGVVCGIQCYLEATAPDTCGPQAKQLRH